MLSLARRRDQRGFSLIDIMFVCAIMATLFALGVPLLTRSKGAAQAASALGTMRLVNSAQLDFAITCGYGFYAPDLPTLGVAPPGSAYAFVGAEMSAGVTVMRAGYNFTVSGTSIPTSPPPCNGVGGGVTASSYALVADPIDPALVPRFFGTNTDGLIYEHTASFTGVMPEGGAPPIGTPIH